MTSKMTPAAQLIAEGRAAAPRELATTAYMREVGASSEAEFKKRKRDAGEIMYHMHVGLSTWEATEDALRTVYEGLKVHGHRVDRYGLAFDRAMGMPEEEREGAVKETGPRISPSDWTRLANAVPIQPHTGDYMIGLPAGFQNTIRALSAGISTIGNIGQHTSYEPIGGSDAVAVTESTVRALGALAALREKGALAHCNLEDGSSTQAANFGSYVGWAALEKYAVEDLIGARLAHCYGNTIQNPEHRAIVHFALDDIRGGDSIGSMVYGNTVDHRAGNWSRNVAAVSAQIMTDIAIQLRRPTGHAVNPVPFTEAERIPSPAEVIETHLLARELEREVRKAPNMYDWARLEATGALVARYALQWRDAALGVFASDGIDTSDAGQVLLALRQTRMGDLEDRIKLAVPDEVSVLKPWKSSNVDGIVQSFKGGVKPGARLDGMRVVLAVLEVHDLVLDALVKALPQAGAEVILLGSGTPIHGVARAAVEEDADAIVMGTYNGNALQLGIRLMDAVRASGWDGGVYLGGVLNQDNGDALPIDARPGLEAIGVHCVNRIDDLAPMLASARP